MDRNDKLLRLTLAEDDKYRVYTSLKNISPLAIESTLIYEDKFFYIHPGINPFSVFRAAWVTFIQKKRVIGASTITMQLSRCLYNINTKSLTGKLRQMFSALKLEFLYSKNEILEAYFNIVPYGFNIEGIGAASLVYFNKYSQRLTLLEALTLTVIPQSPYKRTKHIKKKKRVNSSLKLARNLLLQKWLKKHPENVDKALDFFLELEMHHPFELPFYAPHLVTDLISKYNNYKIQSSINLNIQNTFKNVSKTYMKSNYAKGINNFSAILVDTNNSSFANST